MLVLDEMDESQAHTSLLGKKEIFPAQEEEVYHPVISSKQKKIFFCLSIDCYYWAVYRLFSEVLMVVCFALAALQGRTPVGNLSLLSMYVFFFFIVAPLWQYFSIQKVSSGEDMGCNHGCMLGMAFLHCLGICSGRNLIVLRDDKPSSLYYSESQRGNEYQAGNSMFQRSNTNTTISSGYSRTNTNTSVATSVPNSVVVSRYIPFSIYNLLFIIGNNGQKEMNPNLPYDDMERFGMGRSMLLSFGTSIRASLSIALVVNAYYALLVSEGSFVFTCLSLIALISALSDLDVYLIAVFFGTILYPYTFVVTLAMYFPMFDWVLNPKQGSVLFFIFKIYWRSIISCTQV